MSKTLDEVCRNSLTSAEPCLWRGGEDDDIFLVWRGRAVAKLDADNDDWIMLVPDLVVHQEFDAVSGAALPLNFMSASNSIH